MTNSIDTKRGCFVTAPFLHICIELTPLVLRLFYYIMHQLVLHIFSDMNVVFQW